MTKTNLVIAFLMSASLLACGGKSKKSTTPDNTGGSTANGSAMGGSAYGGATTGGSGMAPMPTTGGADPCGGTN
jgi:hypothetical protein